MLKDSDEFIPVATIRPETILGDTAVAVHPEDERYQKFIGRTALVPMLGREIPVIADDYVSQEFGTGALKITPGHDPNDYDIAQRHHLPVISVLDEAARINENGGPYKGQDRFECREQSVERHEAGRPGDQDRALHDHHPALAARRRDRGADDLHAVVREDRAAGRGRPEGGARRPHPHRAGALREGLLQLAGEHQGLVHQPPAVVGTSHPGVVLPRRPHDDGPPGSNRSAARAVPRELSQDPDVLDTWFSSGLWPFSTLGWPEETRDLQVLLSHLHHGDGLRHPVLLGGAHDHVRPGVHRPGAVRHRLPARADP